MALLSACLPALRSCLLPEPITPAGGRSCQGPPPSRACPSYPGLGTSVVPKAGHGVGAVASVEADIKEGQTRLASVHLARRRAIAPHPWGGVSQGDMGEGGGGKGVTGRSNLRM